MVSSWVESEWDEESREWIAAGEFVEKMTGPNGEWMPDATSGEADPNNYSGWRYVAKGPFVNDAEKTRLDALDAHKKEQGEGGNLNGVYFTVERFDY